eukprot:sb/3466179/
MSNLAKLYVDPAFSGAYTGQNAFFKAAKEKDSTTKRGDVAKVLKASDSYTLHKPVRKPAKFRRIHTKSINYQFQIDLVDMSAYAKENNGYKWIITCIDTFSKKLWTFKLKNKSGVTVLKALKPLIEKEKPQKIETDDGGEFKNGQFLTLLAKHKIDGFTVSSDRKCAIVERVNRTLKTRMFRAFTARGSHRWIDILDKLVAGYNDTYHRSIKMKPNEVNKSNEMKVRRTLFPKPAPPPKPRYRIGQIVRITRKKSVFQKGYEQSWSHEVFEIAAIKATNPPTYTIKDIGGQVIGGSFYDSELQVVDKSNDIWPVERVIRKRTHRNKVQYLVKWSGYPDIFNSWVEHQDLFKL